MMDTEEVNNLITSFSDTWFSLDAYDKDKLIIEGATKKSVTLTADALLKALQQLKCFLIGKGEASDIFGLERAKGSIEGVVGNVMQSFANNDLYSTVEEKAAHLLYFIVKDHPLIDGNKRSGAYAFIWFLNQANILDTTRISPPALTALTLLIAESDPKNKSRLIALICTLLTSRKNNE